MSEDDDYSAPDVIEQLNLEKRFLVWKNLALQLLE